MQQQQQEQLRQGKVCRGRVMPELNYPAGLRTGYPGFSAGSNPYMNATGLPYGGYPGTTVTGYGANPASSEPYPNYAAPQRTFSPYSAFPSTGLGTNLYGH